MRENRLRLFGYVMKREISDLVRTVIELNVKGRIGNSKKWLTMIECNMKTTNVYMNDEGDRVK